MDYYFEKQKETVVTPKPAEVETKVEVTEAALLHLDETRKWSKFIAVFCIVMAGFMAFSAIVLLLAGTKTELPGAGILGIAYLIFAVLTFVPMLFLVKFSNYAKKAVANKNNSDLEEALKYQKFYYVATGIMVIISIIFVVAFAIAGFTMGFVSGIMQSQNV